jgi:hypothetical protein
VKQLFLCLLFAAVTLSAADLTGKWTGPIERVGGPPGGVHADQHYITLKQTGTSITGTAGPKREVQWDIVNARLDGAKLTFETAAPPPSKLALVYTLEFANGELAGTMEMKPPKDVNWKLRLKREQ